MKQQANTFKNSIHVQIDSEILYMHHSLQEHKTLEMAFKNLIHTQISSEI